MTADAKTDMPADATHQPGDQTPEETVDDGPLLDTENLKRLRHDLRTPINAIVGYSELLVEEVESYPDASIVERLRSVRDTADTLLDVVDRYIRDKAVPDTLVQLDEDLRPHVRDVADTMAEVRTALERSKVSVPLADVRKIEAAAGRMIEVLDAWVPKPEPAQPADTAPETDGPPETEGQAADTDTEAEAPEAEPRDLRRAAVAELARADAAREVLIGRILVVDDNPDNREVLERRLRDKGHKVVLAGGGKEAIQLLSEDTYDVVLLDIIMPEIGGYEVLQWLRSHEMIDYTAVIMISALDDLDSVVQCIKLGAVDHLPKPFNPVILNARIQACLQKKQLRDEALTYLAQIEKELKTARELQLGMVPTRFCDPEHSDKVSLYANLSPAHRVGGDFHDFFFAEDGRLFFVIGDVAGKGIPAALNMARTKTLFRMVAVPERHGSLTDAGELLSRINDELASDNPTLTFVTALLGILDTGSGAVQLATAGHLRPLRLSPQAGARPSEVVLDQGIPLGLEVGFAYRTEPLPLAPGDGLLLITDGVVDTMNTSEAFFGEERLYDTLSAMTDRTPRSIIRSMRSELADFSDGQDQFDDVTMLAIRYREMA